jgi:hypothetical protein
MAQLNIPTIAPTLNQVVAKIQTQFENQTNAFNSVVKRGKKDFVNGKGERIPNYILRPTGITAGTEGFSFNSPGLPTFGDMYVYPAEVALAYELSDKTIRNFNAGSEYTQIQGMSDYMGKVADALTKALERTFFGNGQGSFAIAASASGSTITFRSTPASAYGSTKGSVWIEIGENYDLINGSTGAVRGQVRFTSVPTSTTAVGVFTGFAAADVADGDLLVTANGYFNYARGLAYIVNNDTGTFQLISRSTYPQFKANVVDLAGNNITVSDFDQALALAEVRGDSMESAKQGMGVWMARAQWSALTRLGQNLKRFQGTDTKFDGSFQTFGFGPLTMNVAVDCDEDRFYFVKNSDLFILEDKPFGAYDADGNQLRMKAGTAGVGSTSFTGAMGIGYQVAAMQPRSYSLIKRAGIVGLPTQVAAY